MIRRHRYSSRRACAHCGLAFLVSDRHPAQRYHSTRCRVAALRARRRAAALQSPGTDTAVTLAAVVAQPEGQE